MKPCFRLKAGFLFLKKRKVNMNTKYGIVVLLDALGTRTADMETAELYLKTIKRIQERISKHKKIKVVSGESETDDASRTRTRIPFRDLKSKFFGDSILLTFEIKKGDDLLDKLMDLCFIVNGMIINALDAKIPFRGAISIGKYIEKAEVALGPAIYDAAIWHEQVEQIGVICTPSAKNIIIAEFYRKDLLFSGYYWFLRLDDVRIKGNTDINTLILDWPFEVRRRFKTSEVAFAWYYDAIKELRIPFGVENKYANTEMFFKKSISLDEKREAEKKTKETE
jgi:hypothetical protein